MCHLVLHVALLTPGPFLLSGSRRCTNMFGTLSTLKTSSPKLPAPAASNQKGRGVVTIYTHTHTHSTFIHTVLWKSLGTWINAVNNLFKNARWFITVLNLKNAKYTEKDIILCMFKQLQTDDDGDQRCRLKPDHVARRLPNDGFQMCCQTQRSTKKRSALRTVDNV